MKIVDMIAWILLVVGGLNWGAIGLAQFNFVDAILGADSGITRLVYVLVGLSALYTLCRCKGACATSCKK